MHSRNASKTCFYLQFTMRTVVLGYTSERTNLIFGLFLKEGISSSLEPYIRQKTTVNKKLNQNRGAFTYGSIFPLKLEES